MREQVPYRIVRGENNILMFFEPSTIEPPEFTKAKKKVVSGTTLQGTEIAANEVKQSENVQAVTTKKKTLEEEILGPKKKFTGEKIKLDFYETDIKNVFRILRSVGGLNFAIDKNVEGKVTLALENPVPWDQVLDLVLKMNSLGMKQEGNVIRIATLDTIKKEDKLLEETINARKKSIEQKESFEPLITEYIPINYSDAESEVKPHIEQILSKDRGKISVDKRSNMIIITDTQAKIDQAKEIIFRLDQVTPQIMIEAKVVEVTKDFSRDLGLGLSLTQSRTSLASSGKDRNFTVALNNPISAAVNAGTFNFWRIFGSNSLSLNAQIEASETKGDAKVVSSPRILTIDNKMATIKQGIEFAYLERDDTGGSSVKFKNIDLLLEVTPHVTPDQRVRMVIHLTKNDIRTITNGVPSLSTKEATTELLVNNNDTIVIGGVTTTEVHKDTTGTPFLSGIPLLGRLFRTDSNDNNRNEVLIFITPSIIQLDQKRNNFTSNKQ
jgi:type IV pilus assembly protein PilQ